jgi:chromate transport protein ChrA
LPLDKVITAEDRKMRLPWWGVLCGIFGTILLAILFDHFGKLALARPSLISVAIVTIVIAMRWKLRRHVWFWITMTILAALHLPLILFVPWTTKWVPALVIVPIGFADLYAMLWVLSVVGKFMEGPKSAER